MNPSGFGRRNSLCLPLSDHFALRLRHVGQDTAIQLVKETMQFVCEFEGTIPGSAKEECGNYLSHDLEGAKRIAEKMRTVLKDWTPEHLTYPE